jgi:uncharacterized protein YcaQ
VTVEGLRGLRLVVASDLPWLDQAIDEVAAGAPPGRAAPGVSFLAPLDPFCWDRDLLRGLFDFDYVWEVYVPQARRRWGYYVLPILFGDRLVGRIEPRLDRKARVVRVLGLSWEPGFDPLQAPGFAPAFAAALDNYAGFGGADSVVTPPGAAHLLLFRSLAGEVRVSRGESGAPKPVRASPTGRRTASTLRGGVIDATIALSQH